MQDVSLARNISTSLLPMSTTMGVWTNSPACSQDYHSFAKGKPDCRCGAARRAVCPECGREFETEEE